jgi:hypothetical protein
VVRCSPAPSVGAAIGASTCSSPLAPAPPSWSSGGGKSGSIASISGAGSAGVGPSGADGLGAGTAMIGPALVDSSWADDPGAGVVKASFSWRSAALAALMKSKSVNIQVEKSERLLCNQMQTYSVDFFLMALFTRKACRGVSIAGGGVSPASGAVPATALVTVAAVDGAASTSSGSVLEVEAEGLQGDTVSM